MPAGLTASDQKLLRIGGALLIAMLAVTVFLAPRSGQNGPQIPSTYSAESGGAKAAYLLLTSLHYPVQRWEEPPTELNADLEDEDILLILAEPVQLPSKKEREAVVSFVRKGGHVLFTGAAISEFFRDASVFPIYPGPDWKTYTPSVPGRISRGVHKIAMEPGVRWGHFEPSQLALYGEGDSATVVRWRLGKGDVLWWAGSTPLTNAGITRDDNMMLFLNSLATENGTPDEIFWDEYFHGQRVSPWSYVRNSAFGWGFWQLLILGIAVVFTFSRRSGPVYQPAPVSRLSPLEFVDTLGGLYERAGAASSAVQVSYQRLRSLLTRQLGLGSATRDEELASAAEHRLGWKDAELASVLARAQSAGTAQKLKSSEALEIVRELEQRTARFDLRRRPQQEKS